MAVHRALKAGTRTGIRQMDLKLVSHQPVWDLLWDVDLTTRGDGTMESGVGRLGELQSGLSEGITNKYMFK
jgi:hypothetical protein